jgi:hypothetical protein
MHQHSTKLGHMTTARNYNYQKPKISAYNWGFYSRVASTTSGTLQLRCDNHRWDWEVLGMQFSIPRRSEGLDGEGRARRDRRRRSYTGRRGPQYLLDWAGSDPARSGLDGAGGRRCQVRATPWEAGSEGVDGAECRRREVRTAPREARSEGVDGAGCRRREVRAEYAEADCYNKNVHFVKFSKRITDFTIALLLSRW